MYLDGIVASWWHGVGVDEEALQDKCRSIQHRRPAPYEHICI